MKSHKDIHQKYIDTFHDFNMIQQEFDRVMNIPLGDVRAIDYPKKSMLRAFVWNDYNVSRKDFRLASLAYENSNNPYHISYYVCRIIGLFKKLFGVE